jgi:uncharacterized protein YkwD
MSRHRGLRLAVLCAAGAAITVTGALASAPSSAAPGHHGTPRTATSHVGSDRVVLNSFEAQLLADMNRVRRAHHLPALIVEPGTTDVARHWSWQLARAQSLSHNPNLVNRLEHHGSRRWTEIEENVGYGPITSPDELFRAYMNSPPHRENILGRDVRYVGVGVVQRGPYAWNAVDFVNQYSGSYGPSQVPADGLLTDTVTPRSTMQLARGPRARAQFGAARTNGVNASRVRFTGNATRASFSAQTRRGHGDLIFRDALSLRHVYALRFRLGAVTGRHKPIRVAIKIGNGWWMQTLRTVWVSHPRAFTVVLASNARRRLNTIEFRVSGRTVDTGAHHVTLSVANLTAVAG